MALQRYNEHSSIVFVSSTSIQIRSIVVKLLLSISMVLPFSKMVRTKRNIVPITKFHFFPHSPSPLSILSYSPSDVTYIKGPQLILSWDLLKERDKAKIIDYALEKRTSKKRRKKKWQNSFGTKNDFKFSTLNSIEYSVFFHSNLLSHEVFNLNFTSCGTGHTLLLVKLFSLLCWRWMNQKLKMKFSWKTEKCLMQRIFQLKLFIVYGIEFGPVASRRVHTVLMVFVDAFDR